MKIKVTWSLFEADTQDLDRAGRHVLLTLIKVWADNDGVLPDADPGVVLDEGTEAEINLDWQYFRAQLISTGFLRPIPNNELYLVRPRGVLAIYEGQAA